VDLLWALCEVSVVNFLPSSSSDSCHTYYPRCGGIRIPRYVYQWMNGGMEEWPSSFLLPLLSLPLCEELGIGYCVLRIG